MGRGSYVTTITSANSTSGYHSFPSPADSIAGAGLTSSGPSYSETYSRALSKIIVSSPVEAVGAFAADRLLPGRMSGTRVTLIGMLILFILDALLL